jgi:prepilin-type N-terminal cleavage/methylation domain-containing protein
MKIRTHVHTDREGGFTLLELLVSVSILGIIATLVAQAFFTVFRSNSKTEILKDVKQSGERTLQTMTRMIQSAQEVYTCEGVGVPMDALEIVNSDGGETIFGCVLDGTVTRIASISATNEFLTDSHVTIGGDLCASSSLAFECTTQSGAPSKITITFSLAQIGTPVDQFETASENFQGSVIVRNERQ